MCLLAKFNLIITWFPLDPIDEFVMKGSLYFMIHSSTSGLEESSGQALIQNPGDVNPTTEGDKLKKEKKLLHEKN